MSGTAGLIGFPPRIPPPGGPFSSRVTVTINGFQFQQVVRLMVSRDLANIAGVFDVVLVDDTRLFRALPFAWGRPEGGPETRQGQPITIAIDKEPVLIGWIDRASFRWSGEDIECHLQGRDKTGDLVDCAALPNGPAEFRGVDLLHVAEQVCKPFGIPVKAEVSVGAPFTQLALQPHMTALALLESGARQRSILLVSDGVGGLLLTRGGNSKAPAALRLGENVQEITAEFDWTHRFSEYIVKQTSTRTNTGGAPLLTTAPPLAASGGSFYGPFTVQEMRNIINTGRAIDPEVTRYRPTVRLTRTQSGMTSVQEQAEWMLRLARGLSDSVQLRVLDWRAGPGLALWRPNAVTQVWDPYSGLDKEMLIAGVAHRLGPEGAVTDLRIAGRTAYDRIDEAEQPPRRRGGGGGGPLLTTAPPLRTPPAAP